MRMDLFGEAVSICSTQGPFQEVQRTQHGSVIHMIAVRPAPSMERASCAAAACCAARFASFARTPALKLKPMCASRADRAGPTMPAVRTGIVDSASTSCKHLNPAR